MVEVVNDSGPADGEALRRACAKPERGPNEHARNALLIIIMGLILGTGLPALLSYRDGVFFQDEVRRKLPPIAARKMLDFETDQDRAKKAIARIDHELDTVELGSQAHQILQDARRQVSAEARSQAQPIQYFSFMLLPSTHFYFPIFFMTLGALAVLMYRKEPKLGRRQWLVLIASSTSIYVIWQWFHWIRNFVAGEEARFIYSYTNWDISPTCFLYQELEIMTISLLIGTIWTRSLAYHHRLHTELASDGYLAWSQLLDEKTNKRLSKIFSSWQLESALLVGAFTSFFVFYWRNIYSNHDERYLSSALSIHAIGIASWAILSLPLRAAWKDWQALRFRAIRELADSSDEVPRLELRIKGIEAVRPVGHWNLVVSSTILALSFLAPFAKILMG